MALCLYTSLTEKNVSLLKLVKSSSQEALGQLVEAALKKETRFGASKTL